MDLPTLITYGVIGFAGLLLLLLILCVVLIILLIRVIRLHSSLSPQVSSKKEFPIYKYTAIIIEPSCHKALSFVLKNIQDNLPGWGIVLFHGNQNKTIVKSLNLSNTTLVQLPLDNMNKKQYNEFMKSSLS